MKNKSLNQKQVISAAAMEKAVSNLHNELIPEEIVFGSRKSLQAICHRSVLSSYPLPYGQFIDVALNVYQEETFNTNSLKVALAFLATFCLDPQRMINSDWDAIENKISEDGTIKTLKDELSTILKDIADTLNLKEKKSKDNLIPKN